MNDRLDCHIRYRFQPKGKWLPSYDVIASGRGICREVRIVNPSGKVLHTAKFHGTLNSNRAREFLMAYLDWQNAIQDKTTCCNGDPE